MAEFKEATEKIGRPKKQAREGPTLNRRLQFRRRRMAQKESRFYQAVRMSLLAKSYKWGWKDIKKGRFTKDDIISITREKDKSLTIELKDETVIIGFLDEFTIGETKELLICAEEMKQAALEKARKEIDEIRGGARKRTPEEEARDREMQKKYQDARRKEYADKIIAKILEDEDD